MRTTLAQIGLAVLLATFTYVSQAGEIIIDNKQAQFTGNWQTSLGSTQKYDKDYRFSSSTDAPQAASTAEFRPNIAAAGRYNVDIWYTSGDNRSTTAPVVVSSKTGLNNFVVNEKVNGGKWINVAKDLEFETGTAGFVLIGNNTGATGAVVVADAIRLVQVSGDAGYSITLSPTTGGTIMKEPSQSAYAPGSTVQLSAIPEEGFVFNGWTGDASGSANPLSVAINKDKTIGATFVQGGVGVVMEYDEADYKGEWTKGDRQWGKPHGEAFKWTSVGKGTGKQASATYAPTIKRAGLYDVYVWYTPGGNRSESSPFEISCKSGKQVVKLSQKTGGNDWVLLAPAQEFEAGKSGYVRLFSDVEEPSAVIVSDAVAFVYVGGPSGQSAKK
jgi:uncharacterized repeat protein (TIGR02543 family)